MNEIVRQVRLYVIAALLCTQDRDQCTMQTQTMNPEEYVHLTYRYRINQCNESLCNIRLVITSVVSMLQY